MLEEDVPGFPSERKTWFVSEWRFDPCVLWIAPPLACVKVDGPGRDWWVEQDMPPTWTVGCTASRYGGLHMIYELTEGFELPLAAMQEHLVDTVTRFWTRVPPHPTKFWIAKVRPALLNRFPEVPEGWRGTHTPWYADWEQCQKRGCD